MMINTTTWLRRMTVLVAGLALTLAGLVLPSRQAAAVPPADFFAQAVEAAQAGEAEYGVPASVALAQAALESGWGESSLTKEGNAYFGIKCGADNGPFASGCMEKETQECDENGNCGPVMAEFRVYDSAADSFKDHGHFLSTKERYAAAFTTDNADDFIREVHKAGYATDPNYSSKIIGMMQEHNLYQYNADGDGGSEPSKPTIKKGSEGAAVTEAQNLLNDHGYTVDVDGIFGPATDAAVRKFQQDKGLEVDGVVGPATWGALQK